MLLNPPTASLFRRGAAFALALTASACGGPDAPGAADAPAAAGLAAPTALEDQGDGALVDFMKPRGRTRTIDFTVDEGTQLSVDISPDGEWILFDLLGHVWRMPASGGEAVSMTQGSGVALNFHPSYSPDGSKIAFVSDRGGQNNIWIMNADGSDPQAVYLDENSRFSDPAWSPDGKSIVSVRTFPSPARGWHRRNMTLWRLPLDEDVGGAGGAPEELKADAIAHFTGPAYAPDGASVYYEVAYSTWGGNGLLKAGHRLQQVDLATGETRNVRLDEPIELSREFIKALNSTGYAADVAGDNPATMSPLISPDGKYMAFAQEVPDETFTYRGHEFGPKTTIFIRDLETGEERRLIDQATMDGTRVNAQYAYRAFPGYAWTPDSAAIIAAYGGKIHRIDIATGEETVIPFTARVRREISEEVRSRVDIDDETLTSKFLQWPTSSPDGERLVFVALGRLWTLGANDAAPRPLTDDMGEAVQLTPAFSPDGGRVAFTTWENGVGGALWTVAADGGAPTRVTQEAGEYIYPEWSPDGARLLVIRRSGGGENGGGDPFALSSPFPGRTAKAPGPEWALTSFSATEVDATERSAGRELINLFAPVPPHFGPDGRIYFRRQDNPAVVMMLFAPYPPPQALAQTVKLSSVAPDGSDRRDHLEFPARLERVSNRPLISPDGRWVAYEAARSVYVAPFEPAGDGLVSYDGNPNLPENKARRIGDGGGVYTRWRNATTLEFMAGNTYTTHNAATGETTTRDITLRVPRDTPRETIALTGAKIVTIDGDRVIDNGAIVVKGARIACVGACDTSDAARTIDLAGKTVIPGLIDVHSHHTGIPSGVVTQHHSKLALSLAYGVTTIVDPATLSISAFPLAEMVEAGRVVGPRTFSSAEVVITQAIGWGDNLEVVDPESAAYGANHRTDWGAIELKNYRLAARRHHQLLLDAARDVPVTVTAEGGPLLADIGYAMDGQTGWEHLIAQIPLYADAAEFLGRAGAHYSPTAIVAGHVNGSKEYFRPRAGLLDDAKYNRFIARSALEQQHAHLPDWPKKDFSFPIIAEGLADIIKAGGYGAIGEHGEQPGIGSHWELWAYAEAMSPLEALRVATLHGAHFMGLDHELGSIETGKIADLVILNSDPTEDIRNSADIAYVMKAGNLYDDETLDRLWPDQKPFGAPHWQ